MILLSLVFFKQIVLQTAMPAFHQTLGVQENTTNPKKTITRRKNSKHAKRILKRPLEELALERKRNWIINLSEKSLKVTANQKGFID